MRILGKMGGRNRRVLKYPPALQYADEKCMGMLPGREGKQIWSEKDMVMGDANGGMMLVGGWARDIDKGISPGPKGKSTVTPGVGKSPGAENHGQRSRKDTYAG